MDENSSVSSVALPLASATSDSATQDRGVKIQIVHNLSKVDTRTFRVTLSPKEDIDPEVVKWFLKTYEKCNKYVVIEQGQSGKKHLHALLQFDGPKEVKSIKDVVWRNMRKYHGTSIQKFAVVINVCYNMLWYDEYLRKEEDVENVDTDDFDAKSFRRALPDEATQTLLQSFTRHKPIGAMWTAHEERWIKFSPDDASFPSAVRYLNTRMFKDRDLEPIADMRKFNQLAHTLTKFRNKFCDVEPVNLQYYNQMTHDEVFQNMR